MLKLEAGSIEKLADLLEVLNWKEIAGSRGFATRFWFRGQPAEFQLLPGVYRQNFLGEEHHDPDTKEQEAQEKRRRKREFHLMQDFQVNSAGLQGGLDEVPLYFLQQHYRMPTRLLDWTQSALIAIYFAVSDQEDRRDAAWFMMDIELFVTTEDDRPGYKGFRGVADARNNIIKNAVKVISWWKDPSEFPKFTFPTRPDYSDRRMVQQRSCFTFHVPSSPGLTKANNGSLEKYIIPAAKKHTIRRELALLGVDEFSVFSDLEALAKALSARRYS